MSLAACGSDDISSDEEARRAYLGLDMSIEKSLTLGFAGFNAAQSANIPPQMTAGAGGGTLTITGQVDQGAGANKGMRLRVGMVNYTDGQLHVKYEDKTVDVDLTYNTNTDTAMQPSLDLSLKGIPTTPSATGTFTGMLSGVYNLKGDIESDATLTLMFSGTISLDASGKVIRTPATTMVTGTAQSGDGTYQIDLTI